MRQASTFQFCNIGQRPDAGATNKQPPLPGNLYVRSSALTPVPRADSFYGLFVELLTRVTEAMTPALSVYGACCSSGGWLSAPHRSALGSRPGLVTYEICGGHSSTVSGFLPLLRFPCQSYIPPIAPQSSPSIMQGWYNRPINDLSDSGLGFTLLLGCDVVWLL
jgi:hypothetical protein